MTPSTIYITKADGTREPFKEAKLRQSLKRAGATQQEIQNITSTISSLLADGDTTEIIYRKAFELLRGSVEPIAARYSLRRALFGLGPTGFPFEDYLARLFRHDGYKTKTRLIAKGNCGVHELDVVAYTPEDTVIVEAKFHQQPGIKTDLQVILYTHARFLDLKSKKAHPKDGTEIRRSMVVTNTKFTKAAIDYAECAGVSLISWDYPRKGNLHDWIEATGLYPVTVLSGLNGREKTSLMQSGAILCSDVVDNHALLSAIGIPKSKIQAVLEESVKICLPK